MPLLLEPVIGFGEHDESDDVATPHAKEIKEPKGRAAKMKAAKEAADALASASAKDEAPLNA